MIEIAPAQARAFRRRVLSFYRRHGRKLWFRTTSDPYRITVSEIMLQQTPVERVLPKYRTWVKRWSGWRSLSKASNRDVLAEWSGLGYNRRALYLKQLARAVTTCFDGRLPQDRSTLLKLPGIGPYTANAILVFAFDQRLAAVDTNVRKAILYEFHLPPSTPPKEIEAIATALLPKGDVKEWHHALMDYARLALPARIEATARTAKSLPFDGSLRQIRGQIIRQLTTSRQISIEKIIRITRRSRADVNRAVTGLSQDGMVTRRGDTIRLAQADAARLNRRHQM